MADAVLQQFAALLRERVRRSDIACRFGGETLVRVADARTYRAKAQGWARACFTDG